MTYSQYNYDIVYGPCPDETVTCTMIMYRKMYDMRAITSSK